MKEKESMGLIPLVALSTVGNFIISPVLSSDDGTDIITPILATLISILVVILLKPLAPILFVENDSKSSKITLIFRGIIYTLTNFYLLVTAVFIVKEFCEYANSVVLPNVPISVLFALIVILAIISALGKLDKLLKTSLILFFVTALFSIVIFVFSVPKMDFKYIVPTSMFNIKNVLQNSGIIYIRTFGEVITPIILIGGLKKAREIFVSNILAGGIILLCILNTLLVFGGGFAATLKYPYSEAVSAVNLGDIFSRMDGFVYIIIFITSYMKIALILYSVKELGKKLYRMKKVSHN